MIRSVTSLNLAECKSFDNWGLSQLNGLPNLTYLDISKTRIDDDGLKQLKGNKKRREDNPCCLDCRITKGLCSLDLIEFVCLFYFLCLALPNLRGLNLSGLRITNVSAKYIVEGTSLYIQYIVHSTYYIVHLHLHLFLLDIAYS